MDLKNVTWPLASIYQLEQIKDKSNSYTCVEIQFSFSSQAKLTLIPLSYSIQSQVSQFLATGQISLSQHNPLFSTRQLSNLA